MAAVSVLSIGVVFMVILFIALIAFGIVSIVLFIRDGIIAGQEGRPRKTVFIVLFVIGLICLSIPCLLGIMYLLISSLVMLGL